MAIKEREITSEPHTVPPTAPNMPALVGPLLLNKEQAEALLKYLSEPPKPLTPQIKQAIENYKRIKVEKLS